MLIYIRSCKYCGANPDCPLKREIRESFRSLRLEATAVVNCKRVIPFHQIGDKINVSIYTRDDNTLEPEWLDGNENETQKGEEIASGILVGFVYDRYGHPRTYAVRLPRSYARHFSAAHYADGENARVQFPEIKLGDDEIIAFIRYTSIERSGTNGE